MRLSWRFHEVTPEGCLDQLVPAHSSCSLNFSSCCGSSSSSSSEFSGLLDVGEIHIWVTNGFKDRVENDIQILINIVP